METHLADFIRGTADGIEAEAILRRCVHCGFCTATCPTYQLLCDELDSPRGRIYLIKEVLEGAPATPSTRLHLDRCLTCRNCETTCPSGVQYGRLVDIGRKVVEERATEPRPLGDRLERMALREGLTRRWLFDPAMKIGKRVRPMLPATLKTKVPASIVDHAAKKPFRPKSHPRKMLMLAGCVQPAMAPNINDATMRVLDALGVETVVASKAGCCGAIRHHLTDQDGALDEMRRNVDAWWPQVEAGAEAIVMNASGCGAMVKEYGHLLRNDPAYAANAPRSITSVDARPGRGDRCRSCVTCWSASLQAGARGIGSPGIRPARLQHGQQIRGAGRRVDPDGGGRRRPSVCREPSVLRLGRHLFGTAARARPRRLRDRKLAHLAATEPEAIVSANIGCITHLQSGTETPVLHWIELIANALRAGGGHGLFPGETQRSGRLKRGPGPKPIPDPKRPL